MPSKIAIIAPGHGYLIGKPHDKIRRLIEHRMWRERRVMLGPWERWQGILTGSSTQGDVPVEHRGAAARSLLAHLLKLAADGAIREQDGIYTIASM